MLNNCHYRVKVRLCSCSHRNALQPLSCLSYLLYAVPQLCCMIFCSCAYPAWLKSDKLVHVQIHPVETREGGMALQFEHPTIAGVTVGGWMNRADAKPKIVQVRRS